MSSEWDGTAWAGSEPSNVVRLPERSSSPLAMDDWLNYFQFGSSWYGTPLFSQTLQGQREEIPNNFAGYAEHLKKANAVAFACLDVRRRLFSEARFTFRRLTDGRPGELFGGRDGRNPAYRGLALLANPWPGGTTRDLLTDAIDYADVGGNTFIVRRGGRLVFMRPDHVTIMIGSRFDDDVQAGDLQAEVIGYIYHPGGRDSGRDPVTLLPEEVAHWRPIKDPLASYRGMSWLTPVIREISGDSATTNHKLKYFEQGATPNLAITLDASISIEDAREWIALYKQDHEGTLNAFKTLFLGGGSNIVPVGSDLKNIDFKAVQGAGETRIAAAAGVPPIIVGLSEGLASATYSNYGQARRAFADLTMRPLWGGFCAAIAPLINVPDDAELWYDDRDISFLQEDVKDAADIIKSQASALQVLFNTGYEPDAIVDAVTSGDLRRLEGNHTGRTSVQLQSVEPTSPIQLPTTKPDVPQLAAGRAEVRCPNCDKFVARSVGPGTDMDCPRCKTPIVA
jgi:hypothetical protein